MTVVTIDGERGNQRGKQYLIRFRDGEAIEVRVHSGARGHHILWCQGYPRSANAEYVIRKAQRKLLTTQAS